MADRATLDATLRKSSFINATPSATIADEKLFSELKTAPGQLTPTLSLSLLSTLSTVCLDCTM
jgi:hypothetical protein